MKKPIDKFRIYFFKPISKNYIYHPYKTDYRQILFSNPLKSFNTKSHPKLYTIIKKKKRKKNLYFIICCIHFRFSLSHSYRAQVKV